MKERRLLTLNQRPRVALFLMVAGLLMLSGCRTAHATTSTPPQKTSGQSAQARPPIHIFAEVDTIQPVSPEQLCVPFHNVPYLVAEVTVQSHGAGFWNTPDGLTPLASEIERQGYAIYTPVTFSQLQALRDARTATTKRFLTVGGHTARDTYYFDGMAQLSTPNGHYIIVAQEVIPAMRIGGPETMLVDIEYPITAQGMVIFREAGNPNEPGTGTLATEIAYPLATVKQALAACK